MRKTVKNELKNLMYPSIYYEVIFDFYKNSSRVQQRRASILLQKHRNIFGFRRSKQLSALIDGSYSKDILEHELLFEGNSKCSTIWSHSGSTSNSRKYKCNLCDSVVTTDCAKYQPTKKALQEINDHIQKHRDDREVQLLSDFFKNVVTQTLPSEAHYKGR